MTEAACYGQPLLVTHHTYTAWIPRGYREDNLMDTLRIPYG